MQDMETSKGTILHITIKLRKGQDASEMLQACWCGDVPGAGGNCDCQRLLGRNSLQEVVRMLWGLPESTVGDKTTSGLQSPMDGLLA